MLRLVWTPEVHVDTRTLQLLRTQFGCTHMDLLPFELLQGIPSGLQKCTDTAEGHSSLICPVVPGSPVQMS